MFICVEYFGNIYISDIMNSSPMCSHQYIFIISPKFMKNG